MTDMSSLEALASIWRQRLTGVEALLHTALEQSAAKDARIAELEAEVKTIRRYALDDLQANGARIAELEAALGEATGRIETDGKLIVELEAERDRRAGAEAMREACREAVINALIKMPAHDEARIAAVAAIRALPIPSPPAEVLPARIVELEVERDKAREAGHEEVLSFILNGSFLHPDAPTAQFAREVVKGWAEWGKAQAEKRRP